MRSKQHYIYFLEQHMRGLLLVVFTVVVGCKGPAVIGPPQYAPHLLVSDSFDDLAATARYWVVDLPKASGVTVQLDRVDGNNFMSLKLPENQDAQELAIHRSIDLASVRGQRVRLSVRIRTPKSPEASARVRLSIPPSMGEHTYSDFVDSTSISNESWTTAYAVVDVNRTATNGDVRLILTGVGTAWFDDVRITSLGLSPTPSVSKLPAQLNERLVTLARAIALIRHFHPSDQSASLDWNAFSIKAVGDVLRANHALPMQDILAQLFSRIAPTVKFIKPGDRSPTTLPRDPHATHLARWHHLGLASDSADSPYRSFRDGIDAEESAFTYAYVTIAVPHLSTCHTAEIRAAVRVTSAPGLGYVFATLTQTVENASYIREPIATQQVSEVVIARGEVPIDVQQVRLGIYLAGRSSIEVSSMSFKCQNGDMVEIDAHSAWALSRDQMLYRKEITTCRTGTCLLVRRAPPDTEVRLDRDIVDMDIGSGLHIALPVAVWSDGKNTYPRDSTVELPPPDSAVADLSVRLAAVAVTWGTLSWFYPYFGDQHINWSAALPHALDGAAAANSPEGTHLVLSQLVAELRDGHGRVRHPTHSMLGMLPIALRKFDDQLIVVGGLGKYMVSIPVGSELVSVDGLPANVVYASKRTTVSAATSGFRDYVASLYLSLGEIGVLKHLTLRTPSGMELDALLPLVSRQLFAEDIRERRPKSGTEVAPSIFYVDPMTLDRATLLTLTPSLKQARAVIVDLRGYIKNDAFEFVAHFISHEVHSPVLRTPIVSVRPTGEYQDEGWLLWPASPILTCRMIVLTDARAISAAETLLQIIRDNHLATFIGEPTAGTNGNVNTFSVPGGFDIRFTGLRVSAPDGSTIQGHGIVPDQLVHPTLEGIRAGRDETLEAAIAEAQRPVPK